jgi:23S rRNA (uracil1939-C5)-methyltransferase
VGAEADGIARHPDGTPLYVPLTLPDELVHARPMAARGAGWAAALEEVVQPSRDRVEPPCPHFGSCGGCALQHWREDVYLAWKSDLLRGALLRAGFADPPMKPIARTNPGARRRMDLAVRRTGGRVLVGLHRLHGAEVIDIGTCFVLHPALVRLIEPMRRLFAGLSGLHREGSLVVNLLDAGADLLLVTDRELSLHDRAGLTDFARTHGLPRVSWARGDAPPEPVCVFRPAITSLSGVMIAPAPGAFLQASSDGEQAVVCAVLAGLPGKLPPRARIADLYAGSGTLTFALARHARVTAWELDGAAIATLRYATNASGQAGRIQVGQRDLGRQPVSSAELAPFVAVVLDPPHAGAAAQIVAIATARVPRVVYVSCNPATLARDARVLGAAGYRALAATPIDQFLWSARLESVVVFGR